MDTSHLQSNDIKPAPTTEELLARVDKHFTIIIPLAAGIEQQVARNAERLAEQIAARARRGKEIERLYTLAEALLGSSVVRPRFEANPGLVGNHGACDCRTTMAVDQNP